MSSEDLKDFADTCKVDICAGEEFIKSSLDAFIDRCGDKGAISDQNIEIDCARLAEIEENLTGVAPECPAGQSFNGCATECNYKTCAQAIENDQNFRAIDTCEDNGKKMPGCVCPDGLYLLNGNCVELSKCFETGWTDFGAWSECDHECPDKNGKRSRNRFHRESGEIEVEEETCDNNLDCMLNENLHFFSLTYTGENVQK